MDEKPIRILLIEDNPGDAQLIRLMLDEAPGLKYEFDWVDNLTEGVSRIKHGEPDVIILDLGLPESHGLDTLERLHARAPRVPTLVVLSGLADEHIAYQAVQLGAQDYLVKGKVDSELLVRSIRYAIERSQAKDALQRAHAELEQRVAERTAELEQALGALHAAFERSRRDEEHIRYMAHYDALTGLPNRVLLRDRLRQALAAAHRAGTRVAVLFLDLDYFKHINDSLGHQVGDRLLKMVASRLTECLREGDSVGRLGGDEFILTLPLQVDGADAARVAQKVIETLQKPFIIEGHELHVSASIGISLYPDDGDDVDTLMRTADTAMYHAKETSRRNYRFFTPELDRAAQQRMELENRLRQALARSEFTVHYQPQVDMASGRIFSLEALLRWHAPGKAPISCSSFISIAEETGLILSIGEWVLRKACHQLAQWRESGHANLRMAVNLSARQFYQPQFIRMVGRTLDETGLSAHALDLEITESLLLQRSVANLSTLKRLARMGVQLSIDDFGTGYSSLAYLQRFPVHALKIDQSFVRGIGEDTHATALVTAIIAMAHSLHLKVLAEGVENAAQVGFLLAHGCPSGQGFYFSEALPAEEVHALLERQGLGARG